MKKVMLSALLLALLATTPASAVVFINEIVVNTPGGASESDRFFEYIELMGTPGKKLDGYAVAILNGGLRKLWPAGIVTTCPYEVDEFFSLDGLELGPNGILVLGKEFAFDYPSLLSDANFRPWITDPVWNGFIDTPGNLENDGANTFMLVRNRPGSTEATDPTPPASDLRWGKDAPGIDCEYFPNADENPPGTFLDQWGDGNLDRGEPLSINGDDTLDLKGFATMLDVSDDLEVVDEVSYEQDQGWEYDLDDRTVDVGSTNTGLPERNVHALDDPQGFNPDALTRVDYRTKGDGYAPVNSAVGEMANSNNWQDTATEQWIRGELRTASGGGTNPPHYYENAANANPDAIQPYETNVPLWLDDGVGADFDFTTQNFYAVFAGRINLLAVPFIPGDSDRDGDADQDDIDKIAAVFGDDDWIFSNSFELAPEGDEGDPATQTRPWDVDATGTNGVEASDLQWTLNFQGNTNGQIVGVQYDSATPAASGIVLNSNAGTECTITTSSSTSRGIEVTKFGTVIDLTVSGEVTSGANATSGEENGIMQFVHDIAISAGGVVRVDSVTPAAPFATTRSDIQTELGTDGDLGIDRVNGYTTSFTAGLGSAAELYTVTLRVIGPGSASVSVAPAGEAKFAESTPFGVKIGHTDSHGNPASATYPGTSLFLATGIAGDDDGDGDVDVKDFPNFPACMTGPGGGLLSGCGVFDFDLDYDVDLDDYQAFTLAAN